MRTEIHVLNSVALGSARGPQDGLAVCFSHDTVKWFGSKRRPWVLVDEMVLWDKVLAAQNWRPKVHPRMHAMACAHTK